MSVAGVWTAAAQPWQPQTPPSIADLVPAPDPEAGTARAIDEVIGAQWRAFRARDGAAGFSYASPRLQQAYGAPDAFMAMLRAGYGAVLEARKVEFESFVLFRSYLTRRVRLHGRSGEEQDALYLMTRLADGSWRIAGCILLAPAAQS
jgi:hypothetical protein